MQAADGTPKAAVTVARFIAPPAVRAGRPGRVLIARRGANAVVRWGAAPNARQYVVIVRGTDGRVNQFVTGGATRTVTIVRALPFDAYSASVHAIGGPNMLAGPQLVGTAAGAARDTGASASPSTQARPSAGHADGLRPRSSS